MADLIAQIDQVLLGHPVLVTGSINNVVIWIPTFVGMTGEIYD